MENEHAPDGLMYFYQLPEIDLNPSDEKLREIIAGKDAEIERLKTIIRESVIREKANAARHRKESVPLMKAIAVKDAEIERLKEMNANNWAEYRSKANHPASIKEAIASIDSGPGWVTSITISRTEWFRLLTAIEEIEKDAERYRRLKAQRGAIHIYLEPMTQLSLEMPSHLFQPDNVDSAIDALPEVKK